MTEGLVGRGVLVGREDSEEQVLFEEDELFEGRGPSVGPLEGNFEGGSRSWESWRGQLTIFFELLGQSEDQI